MRQIRAAWNPPCIFSWLKPQHTELVPLQGTAGVSGGDTWHWECQSPLLGRGFSVLGTAMGFLLSQDTEGRIGTRLLCGFSGAAQTQIPEQLLPVKLLIFTESECQSCHPAQILGWDNQLLPKSLFRAVSVTFCSRIPTPALIFLHGHSWHRKHRGKMSKVKKCKGLYFLSHHQAAGQTSSKINIPCPYPHPSLASPGKHPGMGDGEPKFLHQLHGSVKPQHPRLQEGPDEITH